MTNIINNKYKIIEQIGSGSFGSIYKGENIRTRENVAIKVESIKSETKLLKNESIIYQFLSNSPGIPSVKWFGKDTNNYYMVINLLGQSLQNLKDKKGNFSLKLTLQIGIQIINLLKTIHDKGLVHRDIKPDNFLFGLNDTQINIIDFGFCKTYIDGNNMHIKMVNTKNIIGSHMYTSINSHKFRELSRRDDLESLGYMLIYFYMGTLDWQNIESSSDKIIKMKETIGDNTDVPKILIDYLNYVKNLIFEEKPDYLTIINNFKREIEILVKNK